MRRILIWSGFLSVLCLVFSARAQNININFVGQHEPPNSGIAFGDVWGEGDIACLGIWTGYTAPYGVGIYDITTNSAPALKSIYTVTTNANHNQFELGVVRNKIGYFGSWSAGGLHIVSLTNTSSPLRLSKLDSSGSGFNSIHTVFLERDFLYEAAHQAGINTVKVIDVSNPFAPFFVRNIVCPSASKVHQITAVKKGTSTILYTSDFGTASTAPGYTHIWDVSNIGTQPAVLLGSFNSGGSSHSSWPTPDGNTLIVCRETTGGDVRLYDISNPASPVLQCVISPASMGLPSAIPHNPVVVSNLLFLSWYQNGINIFDITDRTKPVRIGCYDTYPPALSASFQGNWGIFPNLGLNKLLLSDIQTGFYIVDASAVLTATNNYPPLLVQQPPASLTATQGTTATIPSFTTGSSIKYQWRSGSVTTSGTAIPDATNSSLVFSNVQTSSSTNYFVISSNALGSVTSSVVALTVTVPQNLIPTITGEPQPAAVYPNGQAVFSVALSGSAPFAYQWRFNGIDISGATTNTFTVTNAQPEQVGNYSVFVTNSYGTATSSNAALMIIDSPYLNSVQAAPGLRSALISWKSTVPSDSQVQFSVASQVIQSPDSMSAMGASFNSSSYIDRKISTNHTILLTGLSPDTRYSFQVISADQTNSYLSGVYQFTTTGTNIIDNPLAAFAGAWTTSSSSSDKYDVDYAFASSGASPTSTATFQPTLPTTGKYNVHVWYPQGGNRANNAPYTIVYSGGTNVVPVNQQIGGGAWQSIGANLTFASGSSGYVQLANNANPSVVLADAVRFAYVDTQDFPVGQTVPTWWENFYFGGHVDPLADPDGDEYSTAEEYFLGTSPVDPDSHLGLEVQASGGAANITFWPYLGNRDYQLLFRTNVNDPTWQVLSPGAITPTPYGHGIFSISTANLSQGFYRIAVQLTTASSFAGKMAIPQGDAFTGFAEASCGPNRIFLKPIGGK